MTDSRTSSRLALVAMMLAGAASAAEPVQQAVRFDAPPAAERGASRQAALESKTRLVKLLLAQSPAVQRIPQSNNGQAKKKLADAQALVAKADAEATAGRIEPAIKLLDEALLEIVSASRLVPDAAQLAAQERSRYAGLSEAVRSFLNLHKGMSERLAAKKVATPAAALDVVRIQGMVDKAEGLAGNGNHKDANVLLGDVYKSIVASLNKMLMAETIVYDQKFSTPAEEFQFEMARNRSYEELIPLALAQLNPPRETAMLSERYVQQSKELRETAQKQAAGGDYQTALKTILDATGHLQRSLRTAGVIVPQAPEGKL